MTEKEYAYRNKLINILNRDDINYKYLLEVLWTKEFNIYLEEDTTQAHNAMLLRKKYGFEDEFGPCRVLEILLYLSIRAEDLLYDEGPTIKAHTFFWRLITNLGLNKYSNANWGDTSLYFQIDEVVTRWVDRKFDKFGNGSPFPLQNPSKDQRKISIWYQMQGYLIENYI